MSRAITTDRAQRLLTALLAGVGGLAGSYAVAGLTPGFVAAPVQSLVTDYAPPVVVTVAITVLGRAGESLALVTALAVTVAGLAVFAHLGVRAGRDTAVPLVGPGLAAAGTWTAAVVLTGDPTASLGAAAGLGLVLAVAELAPGDDAAPARAARRRVLTGLATAAGLTVAGLGLGRRTPDPPRALPPETTTTATAGGGSTTATVTTADGTATTTRETSTGPTRGELLSLASERSLDVEGLEPLVSTDFYEVDKNAADPDVRAGDWTLSVTGAVDTEVDLDYDDLTAMPHQNVFSTLRCVGEALNADLMDNALWTGVPASRILAEAGVTADEECCVMARAADGYYEEFPLAALARSYVVYGMNDAALPRSHGYPVRLLVPGHWGEVNVKWLTGIEVLEEPAEGYWEKRGWHGTGPVTTVAKLHVVDHLDGERARVAGHAFAGTRGVDRVEVSTDGGETWTDACLSETLPGPDVWRQWVHEFSLDGPRDVVVRAVDGTGAVQPREGADPFPNGASGWVSRRVSPP